MTPCVENEAYGPGETDTKPRPSIRAIVPSVTAAGFWRAKSLLEMFRAREVHTVIIANSRIVQSLCSKHQVDHVSPGTNLGFGRAINAAVVSLYPCDFVLIINDDITLSPGGADALVDSIKMADAKRPIITCFDPKSIAIVPGKWSVFLRLSLLATVTSRLKRNDKHTKEEIPRILGEPLFAGFSMVCITTTAWNSLGGFDAAIPFYFEDAEFTTRFRALEGSSLIVVPVGADHSRSSTARLFARELCGVAAWSGFVYLQRLGMRESHARALCILAMLIRLGLVSVGQVNLRHAAGCLEAVRALLRNVEPALPKYDQFI